jgi:glycogen operon protein
MWLTPAGTEMTDVEWNADHIRYLGVRLSGVAIDEIDEHGRPVVGDTLLYLLNADAEPVPFRLPAFQPGVRWHCLFDTLDEGRRDSVHAGGSVYPLGDHAVALFVAGAADGDVAQPPS